jgi:hypothetical protein
VPDPITPPPAPNGALDAAPPESALPSVPAPSLPAAMVTPPTGTTAITPRSAAGAYRTRSRAFAAEAARRIHSLKLCPTLACSLRQIRALDAVQRAYAGLVLADIRRPLQCDGAARRLGTRLVASETGSAAYRRALLRAQHGAKRPPVALLHAALAKASGAITASRAYAACS